MSSGYGFDQLIEILMTSSIDKSKICVLRPCGVSENASFVVDLDAVRFTDLKSDDLGSWNATGTKSTFFRVTKSGIRVSDKNLEFFCDYLINFANDCTYALKKFAMFD